MEAFRLSSLKSGWRVCYQLEQKYQEKFVICDSSAESIREKTYTVSPKENPDLEFEVNVGWSKAGWNDLIPFIYEFPEYFMGDNYEATVWLDYCIEHKIPTRVVSTDFRYFENTINDQPWHSDNIYDSFGENGNITVDFSKDNLSEKADEIYALYSGIGALRPFCNFSAEEKNDYWNGVAFAVYVVFSNDNREIYNTITRERYHYGFLINYPFTRDEIYQQLVELASEDKWEYKDE
ncbi:hypothetical protein [Ruminococcus sp.]|uniref:hypothetical protein n=1 Tax=Ruminococcus sp. TaxID=41978 RepID=UPI0025EB3AF2|nr:hypothetical protein [Ruminococcus sp.]